MAISSFTISIEENKYNISKNTSNITVRGTIKWDGGTYNNYGTAEGALTIDGTTYEFSGISFGSSSQSTGSKVVMTKTLDIFHNADGKKTVKVSGWFHPQAGQSGKQTAAASLALTTIPRAPTITSLPALFYDDDGFTIGYSNPIGGKLNASITMSGVSDTFSKSLPAAGSSNKITFTDVEKKTIWGKVGKETTVKVQLIATINGVNYKSAEKSTILKIKDGGPTVLIKVNNSLQEKKENGDYGSPASDNLILSSELYKIQQLSVTVTATPNKGATIKSIDGEDPGKEASITLTKNIGLSRALSVTVVDSYERSTTKTVDIAEALGKTDKVIYYFPPQINQFTVDSILTTERKKQEDTNIENISDEEDTSTGNIYKNEVFGSMKINWDWQFFGYETLASREEERGVSIEVKDTNNNDLEIDPLSYNSEDGYYKYGETQSIKPTIKELEIGQKYTVVLTLVDQYGITVSKSVSIFFGPVFDWNNEKFRFYVPVEYPKAEWKTLKMWYDTYTSEGTYNTALSKKFIPYKQQKKKSINDLDFETRYKDVAKNLLHIENDDDTNWTDGSDWHNAAYALDCETGHQKPEYIQQGNLVTVRGAISVTGSPFVGFDNYNNIPFASGVPAPTKTARCLCQASQGKSWLLTVTTAGYLTFGRIRFSDGSFNKSGQKDIITKVTKEEVEIQNVTINNYRIETSEETVPVPNTTVGAGEWLPFYFTYSIA